MFTIRFFHSAASDAAQMSTSASSPIGACWLTRNTPRQERPLIRNSAKCPGNGLENPPKALIRFGFASEPGFVKVVVANPDAIHGSPEICGQIAVYTRPPIPLPASQTKPSCRVAHYDLYATLRKIWTEDVIC
jgi:hypothetical protein